MCSPYYGNVRSHRSHLAFLIPLHSPFLASIGEIGGAIETRYANFKKSILIGHVIGHVARANGSKYFEGYVYMHRIVSSEKISFYRGFLCFLVCLLLIDCILFPWCLRQQLLRWDGWGYKDSGFRLNDKMMIEFTGNR